MANPKNEGERPEWETSNVGLMMFTSLMIILLAFFILLSSMAVIDEKRQIEAMGSLIGTFGLMPGGMTPGQEGDKKNISPSTSPMDIIENDMALVKEILTTQLFEQKVRFLKGRTRRIISLESAILFRPDSVDLLPQMKPILQEVANILKGSNYPIEIEGHTDDQPPQTEAFRNNWEISALRAINVFRFLVDEGGVEPKRLSAYGYAGSKPAVPNNSPKNRALNNRIDIVLDLEKEKGDAYRDRVRKTRSFDFRGFNFNIFGDREKN